MVTATKDINVELPIKQLAKILHVPEAWLLGIDTPSEPQQAAEIDEAVLIDCLTSAITHPEFCLSALSASARRRILSFPRSSEFR